MEQVREPEIIPIDPIMFLPVMYWSFAKLYWFKQDFAQLEGLVESLIDTLERLVPPAAERARAVAALDRPPRFMERLQGEGAYEIGNHEYVRAQVARGIIAWCQANQWKAATALVDSRREPTNPARGSKLWHLGREDAELMGMPKKAIAAVEKEAAPALRRLRKRRAEPGEPAKGGRPGHR